MKPSHLESVFKLGKLSLIGILVCFSIQTLGADNFPISFQILDFGGANLWQATQTILRPAGTEAERGDRYKTEEITAAKSGGTCSDYLSNFQKRPLTVMFEQGYLSGAAYKTLAEDLKDKLDARQLRLVTAFSDLTDLQVTALFGNKGVPKDRKLKEWRDKVKGPMVRVSRGTLYAVRGQILSMATKELVPLNVPWEFDSPLGSSLERPFDRSKIKAIVEVGRAHSETDVLPGDLSLMTKILFSSLESEFHFHGISPDDVLVTAHFLDAKHTRFFTTKYPLRPLDPKLQASLENDLRGTLSSYLKIPLPRGPKEWENYANAVTFGSLKELAATPVETLSESAWQIQQRSGGRISGSQALHLVVEFVSALRDDYSYSFLGETSRAPLMIRDRGTSIVAVNLLRTFQKYGLVEGTNEFNQVKAWLEPLYLNPEPDMFMEAWIENNYFFRKAGDKLTFESMEVSNLDPRSAEKYPIEYLASVILSIVDQVKSKIESATPENYKALLRWTNVARKEKGLAPLRTLDTETFFETFKLGMASADTAIVSQLRNLGGIPVEGVGLKFDVRSTSQSAHIDMAMQPAQVFDFGPKEIVRISQVYPNLAKNGRNRLKIGGHKARLNVLQSSYK